MSAALTLFQVEESLQALLDTESMVPAEQLAEFERELSEALKRSIDKRENVADFLLFCSTMQDNCDREIKRIQQLQKSYSTAQDRMETYVISTIEAMGVDDKGRYPTLAGRTAKLSVCRNPDSVDIQNESLIPAEYKAVAVKLPLEVWSDVLEAFSDDGERVGEISKILQTADEKAAVSIDKIAIKRAIQDGATIDGVDLSIGALRLKVS